MPALHVGMDSLLRLKRAASAASDGTTQAPSPAPPSGGGNATETGDKSVGDKMKDALMTELKKLPCKYRCCRAFSLCGFSISGTDGVKMAVTGAGARR